MDSARTECRLATLQDCEDIYQVHVSSIRQVCSKCPAYTSEQIELWAERQSKERYQRFIETGNILVAVNNNKVVGFGHFDKQGDLMETKGLYVSPDSIGRGFGKLMMTEIEIQAKNTGCSGMIVSSSVNAVGFYKKYGFVNEEESVHHEEGSISLQCVKMVKNL